MSGTLSTMWSMALILNMSFFLPHTPSRRLLGPMRNTGRDRPHPREPKLVDVLDGSGVSLRQAITYVSAHRQDRLAEDRVARTDELGQEGKIEDRHLRIQDIQRKQI